jgi:V/A-type H+-transporting ATPase subunit D
MMEGANPTRMELINVKETITLAQKGHHLLKQKRDVLVIELMTLLHTSLTMRDKLNESMEKAYASLAQARSRHSLFELEGVALSVKKTAPLMVTVRNAMGVKLPMMKRSMKRRKISERGYSIVQSSARIDEAADHFERTLEMVLDLAEREIAMKKLLTEIEKTKRRVNALEYVRIPQLQDDRKSITFKLDEMERDSFITLRSVKARLEGGTP